jgi:YVTN family beta-propeller protein
MTGIAGSFIAGAGIMLIFALAAEPRSDVNQGLLLVANKGDRTVSIVDPLSGREIGTVAESGTTGHEVAASPDGRTAWVPIYGNSGVGQPGTDGQTLDVIDLASRQRVASIEFPKPARPHCAVFGPDDMLYVSTELLNSITIIDPRTRRIAGSVPTGQPESHMLALTRDGRRAYTSNVHSGTVSAIDLVARKVIAVIPVASRAQRISLSPDDRHAFTADQTSPRLAVIDTTANSVKTWIPLPGIAYGTCATPDGRWLIAALISTNSLAVIDLEAMKLVRTVEVPKTPQEILVRPDGRVAYASCDVSRKIAELNLATWKVDRLIDVGRGADGLAWAGPR